MRLYFSALLVLFSLISVLGQSHPTEIETRYNDKRTIDFICTKKVSGNYTLYLCFDRLDNSTYFLQEYVLRAANQLKPMNDSKGIIYSYRYKYISGIVSLRKLDTAFVYLLSFSKGEKAEYAFFTPNFQINGGVLQLKHGESYIAEVSDDLATKEMSCKERKRYENEFK